MSFLFGGAPPTTAELVSRYRREIDRAVREIDREAAKLRVEDKALMVEIRRCAASNPAMATQKAQSVVRVRKTAARFSRMRAHMQDVSSRIGSVKSTDFFQRALAAAVGTMRGFNARAGADALQAQVRDFARQNSVMGIHAEAIEEQLEDAFDDEEDDEAVGDVVLDVMLEAGVRLPSVGRYLPAAPAPEEGLEARLRRLRPQA